MDFLNRYATDAANARKEIKRIIEKHRELCRRDESLDRICKDVRNLEWIWDAEKETICCGLFFGVFEITIEVSLDEDGQYVHMEAEHCSTEQVLWLSDHTFDSTEETIKEIALGFTSLAEKGVRAGF